MKQSYWNPTTAALLRDAAEYLILLNQDGSAFDYEPGRLAQIETQIGAHGFYTQSYEELLHGSRLAWRNSVRCVGRKYWASLQLRDCRHLESADEIFAAVVEHLVVSTNEGRIVPTITVFRQAPVEGRGIRIWNEQLIRYAGYRLPDGKVIGDPRQVEFTEAVRRLGWPGGPGTAFDMLPLVIETPSEGPRLFEIPRSAVLEVEISHPEHLWFAELGLRWHALPAIANMTLEVGGIRYTGAPFSGWYMLTEIAARNFADEERYNMLPVIGEKLGLDTHSNRSLWVDRALLELNIAVLHSYRKAGVNIVDHHTSAQHFLEFENREAERGRPTYADWAWIVPPVAGSTTRIFHRSYQNIELRPNFFPQPPAWRDEGILSREGAGTGGCPMHSGAGKASL